MTGDNALKACEEAMERVSFIAGLADYPDDRTLYSAGLLDPRAMLTFGDIRAIEKALTRSPVEDARGACELGFRVEDRGGIMVLDDGVGCHPATDAEVAMWQALCAREDARGELVEALDEARALRDFVFDRTPGGEACGREHLRLRRLAAGHVNRMDALAKSLPSPRGWQDIETAPKDGTEILASHWSGTRRDWAHVAAWHKVSFKYSAGFCEPTHWMPLPSLLESPSCE